MYDAEFRDKRSSALKGIYVGGILTLIEFSGSILTGSLGLSASALNTAVEFLTSLILLFAVKKAEEPPDESHPYGHEKIESLAAMIELTLLFSVIIWVTLQSLTRLLKGEAIISYLPVAIGVNFISITMDFYAYRKLKITSTIYESEAFAAGALHFIYDGLIAVIVIVGVTLYSLGLWYADAVAALAVAGFTVLSCIGVVKSASETLLDSAPSGTITALYNEVEKIDGVKGVHKLRVRRSGKKFFVDMHVEIDGKLSLDDAHEVSSEIERKVREVLPNADVTVHTEPHP